MNNDGVMDIELTQICNPGEEFEYIMLRVNRDCNLKKYLIYDTTYDQDGNISNKLPHFFRFPSLYVRSQNTPFIRLYTTKNYRIQEWVDPRNVNNLILSWRLNETIWNREGDKATLIEVVDEDEIIYYRQK